MTADPLDQDDLDMLEEAEECGLLPDAPACPVCNGPAFVLGDLGRLTWYVCRNCGMQFYNRDA